MSHLSANELKTRGVAAIEVALQEHSEAIVSVRGKDRYVVMALDSTNIYENVSWRQRL